MPPAVEREEVFATLQIFPRFYETAEQDRMERPSDIQGLIYIPFKDDVKDAGLLLDAYWWGARE